MADGICTADGTETVTLWVRGPLIPDVPGLYAATFSQYGTDPPVGVKVRVARIIVSSYRFDI